MRRNRRGRGRRGKAKEGKGKRECDEKEVGFKKIEVIKAGERVHKKTLGGERRRKGKRQNWKWHLKRETGKEGQGKRETKGKDKFGICLYIFLCLHTFISLYDTHTQIT